MAILWHTTAIRPMAEFVGELLLEPRLDQGIFRQDYVEGEKKNLISAIESRRNDKAVYAMQQLLARMCREDPYGLSRLGEPEDIANLTAAELYDYYVRVILKQVIQRILPPMGNEVITLVKDTSLARVVAVYELIWAGEAFIKSNGLIWPLFFTGLYYLAFSGILTVLLNTLERRMDYFRC